MRLQFRLLLLNATVVLLNATPARATYTIEELVIAPAGGEMTGGAVALEFTVGETAVGSGSAGSISMDCGYWEGVPISNVAVADETLPGAFKLWLSGPNPISTSTFINYAIPKGEEVPVFVGIYDVRGALTKTLVRQAQAAGIYSVVWDGRSDGGDLLGAGVYFIKLHAGSFRQIHKIVRLK